MPVLLVYGEAVYRGLRNGSGLELYDYALVALPEAGDSVDDAALAPFFRKLAERAVVIWPETVDEGYARALRHAALLADAGVTAVGIVGTPEDYTDSDARACVDATLASAVARAWPAQGGRPARAVAPFDAEAALDTRQMFADARALLARHLSEPATTLDAILLWCLKAWCVQGGTRGAFDRCAFDRCGFDASARLVLQGNDARADHARALRLVGWLAPAPLVVSRSIAAHLLPAIEAERPTLLLDDVGGGLLYRRDMRTLIAAGAMRDGLFLSARTRAHPSGRSSCFAPAAIATTSVLPDDVRMRAIVVPMAPAAMDERCKRLSMAAPPDEVFVLRARMQAFAASLPSDAGERAPALPRHVSRAVAANWLPLLAIAAAIGPEVSARAMDAASVLADTAPAPASNLALLADIRAFVDVDPEAGVPSAKIIEKLTQDPELPWARIRRGAKLDPRELADRLRPLGLRPVNLRQPGNTFARGYRGADLIDAFARYLGAATPATCDAVVAAA